MSANRQALLVCCPPFSFLAESAFKPPDYELSRATLVPLAEMPDHVVTMNSKVRFQNEDSGQEQELTLVYPHEVGTGEGKISILAPAGSALLGLAVGDSIEWPIRGRNNIHLKIITVTRQG